MADLTLTVVEHPLIEHKLSFVRDRAHWAQTHPGTGGTRSRC